MNTIQRVTKNVSVLLVSQVLNYVLGFFIMMYSVRYLGVDGFGILSLALAFTSIFSIFMDMGLSTLTTREIARDKSVLKDYVSNIIVMKIVLIIVTLVLICTIINLIGYNQQTKMVIYLITFYTVFTIFAQFFYAIFQAYEKMEYQALGTIISVFLLLIGVLIAIYFNVDVISFSLAYVLSGASFLGYGLFVFFQKFSFTLPKFNTSKWLNLINESWPFAITNISTSIYLWIDTILLSLIQGEEAVGLYNASYKLVLVLIFIPVIFNYALFPIMSKYYVTSKESLNIIFEKLFKIMMFFGIPIGFGTVLIADKLILFIYGPEFSGAVIPLQILIWSIVLTFARSPFNRLLESSNRQLVVTKIFVIGVIFNIILNLILIPKYSYVGAGIVTVLTDILILGVLIAITKDLGFAISKNTLISLLKITVASIIMDLVLSPILNINLFVLIGLGATIFILIVVLLRTFEENEIRMIKSIFKM